MTKEITLPGGFFADTDFDFEARLVLGGAARGTGDTGPVRQMSPGGLPG